MSTVIHASALAGGTCALLYAVSTLVAALTALLAPTAARRQDARKVLALLLHRPTGGVGTVAGGARPGRPRRRTRRS